MNKRKLLRFWFGVGISGLFLYLALNQVDIAHVWHIILGINVWYLLASIVIVLVTVFIRALRWKIVLDPLKKVNYFSVLVNLFIGYMLNNILPLRVGEVGRCVLLAQEERMSKSAVLASAVIERSFDLAGLVLYMPFLLLMVNLPQGLSTKMEILGGLLFLIIIGLFFLFLKREVVLRIIKRSLKYLPAKIREWIAAQMGLFFVGLSPLADWKRLGSLLILSSLGWFGVIYAFFLRFKAFNLDLPFNTAIFCVMAVNFSAVLPSSPGQIGVVHYAYVFALSFFGIKREVAVAFGIISHTLSYLLTTLPGLIFVAAKGIRSLKVDQ